MRRLPSKDAQATQKALAVLREFVLNAQNAELVWRSVRVAHSTAGMTQQECIDCLKDQGEYRAKDGTIKQKLDLSKDIYCQLGLQEWVKYLYYGGNRKVGKDANGAADYSAFYDVDALSAAMNAADLALAG